MVWAFSGHVCVCVCRSENYLHNNLAVLVEYKLMFKVPQNASKQFQIFGFLLIVVIVTIPYV